MRRNPLLIGSRILSVENFETPHERAEFFLRRNPLLIGSRILSMREAYKIAGTVFNSRNPLLIGSRILSKNNGAIMVSRHEHGSRNPLLIGSRILSILQKEDRFHLSVCRRSQSPFNRVKDSLVKEQQ